jgi:RNA polymerase sigma factor (TIGR02999 family)
MALGEDTALTTLLKAWHDGDAAALERLMPQVHAEIVRMARSRLRGESSVTLSHDDLVNEALLRLLSAPPAWQNRAHFFATVALTLRAVLVDHARARSAQRRGGAWQALTMTLSDLGEEAMTAELLTLDALLGQFEVLDPRASQVIQMSCFVGLSRSEIAAVLGVSVPTVDRELRFARAWLGERLGHSLDG